MSNLQIKMIPNSTTSRVHLKSDNSLYVYETALSAQVFDDGKETTIPVDLIVLNLEKVIASKGFNPSQSEYKPVLQYSDTLGYVHTTTVNNFSTVVLNTNEKYSNFTVDGAKIGVMSIENVRKLVDLFECDCYTNEDLKAFSPIFN